jgi:hypothetical protein
MKPEEMAEYLNITHNPLVKKENILIAFEPT